MTSMQGKTFYQLIYEWVADNFGISEAEDPSWNIKKLAKHLSESNIHTDELHICTRLNCYDDIKKEQ